jgi:hypothetical protein
MISIVYNLSGNPEKAAQDAAKFFASLPEELKERVSIPQANNAPRVARPAVETEEEKLRAEYQNTFGKRFRLRIGQNAADICAIISDCLASGKDNGNGAGGSATSGEVKGETFTGEIDLENPPED